MSAFEAVPRLPEQQAARRKQRGAAWRSIPKRPRRDERDRNVVSPLLERAILRTGRAHDVEGAPAVTLPDEACGGAARAAALCTLR